MADVINETKYKAMISALYHFSGRVGTLASEMQTLALVVKSALEEEDSAVPAIYSNISTCARKYSDLASEALKLAGDIHSELEIAKREQRVWSDDD